MHVPKTAGTSLLAFLSAATGAERAAFGFDRVLFGDFTDFAGFGETPRRAMFLSPDRFPDADLIGGHLAYSTLRRHYPDAQCVTVLREPVCRLLSHWLFWRGHDDDRLAEWGSWADRVRLSRQPLAAFLGARSLACQNDNLVVRMLLWPHKLIPPADFIDPAHDRRLLAEARRALAGFGAVDIVENPTVFGRLKGWLGATAAPDRRNETGCIPPALRRPLQTELTTEALDLVAERSRLDLELWNDAARAILPGCDIDRLREQAMLHGIARAALLMAGVPTETGG